MLLFFTNDSLVKSNNINMNGRDYAIGIQAGSRNSFSANKISGTADGGIILYSNEFDQFAQDNVFLGNNVMTFTSTGVGDVVFGVVGVPDSVRNNVWAGNGSVVVDNGVNNNIVTGNELRELTLEEEQILGQLIRESNDLLNGENPV